MAIGLTTQRLPLTFVLCTSGDRTKNSSGTVRERKCGEGHKKSLVPNKLGTLALRRQWYGVQWGNKRTASAVSTTISTGKSTSHVEKEQRSNNFLPLIKSSKKVRYNILIQKLRYLTVKIIPNANWSWMPFFLPTKKFLKKAENPKTFPGCPPGFVPTESTKREQSYVATSQVARWKLDRRDNLTGVAITQEGDLYQNIKMLFKKRGTHPQSNNWGRSLKTPTPTIKKKFMQPAVK